MITPEVDLIKRAVEAEYGPQLRSMGVYNRRPIAGSKTWSQHSWGNAWDIGWALDLSTSAGQAVLDRISLFLKDRRTRGLLPVGTILWRVPAHYDHIHVEGKTKQRGVPPLPGGDDMTVEELTKELQLCLLDAGYKLPRWGADGDFGAETKAAMTEALRGGGATVEQVLAAVGSRLLA